MNIRMKEYRHEDGKEEQLPVFKCKQSKDRLWFKCPKCGEKRSHSNEAGFRQSHCISSGLTTTTSKPDCWPGGYLIED